MSDLSDGGPGSRAEKDGETCLCRYARYDTDASSPSGERGLRGLVTIPHTTVGFSSRIEDLSRSYYWY
jgi:hypothetical protein